MFSAAKLVLLTLVIELALLLWWCLRHLLEVFLESARRVTAKCMKCDMVWHTMHCVHHMHIGYKRAEP